MRRLFPFLLSVLLLTACGDGEGGLLQSLAQNNNENMPDPAEHELAEQALYPMLIELLGYVYDGLDAADEAETGNGMLIDWSVEGEGGSVSIKGEESISVTAAGSTHRTDLEVVWANFPVTTETVKETYRVDGSMQYAYTMTIHDDAEDEDIYTNHLYEMTGSFLLEGQAHTFDVEARFSEDALTYKGTLNGRATERIYQLDDE